MLSEQDVFLRSLSHEKLKKWHMGSIECGSHEDAVKRIESMYELPKQHFIKCFFPCVVDGSVSMAVEEYKKVFSYPTKGHSVNAIRYFSLFSLENRKYHVVIMAQITFS